MNATSIDLLILDVDGVLTDGGIFLSDDGERLKRFHVQDGMALKCWLRAGRKLALLSSRQAEPVRRRAEELGITCLRLGAPDKLAGYRSILEETGVADAAVACVGDDLPDLGPLRHCGLPIAVANAVPEVKRAALVVTRKPGGSGAVAEIVEWLLRKQGRWDAARIAR